MRSEIPNRLYALDLQGGTTFPVNIEGLLPPLKPEFPDERERVLQIQNQFGPFTKADAIIWGQESGTIDIGKIDCAEMSLSLRCPEDCEGCPDRVSNRQSEIEQGLIPRIEPQASLEELIEANEILVQNGVKHVIHVGGTVDAQVNLPPVVKDQLRRGLQVSEFSDCIPYLNEDFSPSALLLSHLGLSKDDLNSEGSIREKVRNADGWLQKSAIHVSVDYPFGHMGEETNDLFADKPYLPPRKGRVKTFKQDPELSRIFKSQYGAAGMRMLIEMGVRRVVANMTIAHSNFEYLDDIYAQTKALFEYAESIGSPTEVLFTFSPWIWRPHQARGDKLSEHQKSAGLHQEDMPALNESLNRILNDTYERIDTGRPRILANSSGYTELHANPTFSDIAVNQDVAYPNGKAL